MRHEGVLVPPLAVGFAALLFPGLAVAAIEPFLTESPPALPLAELILASAAACLAMRGLLASHPAGITRGRGQAPDRAPNQALRPVLSAVGDPNAEQGSVPGRATGRPQGAEQHLQQAIESAPSAIVMVDSHGRIVFANALAERMFGYCREQILGQPVEVLVPDSHRSEHAGLRGSFHANPSPRRMGAGRELFARRSDGSEFPVEIGLNPIETEEGRWVISVIADISERRRYEVELRRSEQRFRQVVESAPSAMVMVDAEGRIVLVNAQAERIFGYSREELLGRGMEMLVPASRREQHRIDRLAYYASPATRQMGVGRELYAMRKDGTEFPVEIGLNPIDTEDGCLVLSDITDISERRQAQEQMARALREKTVLLDEIHHRVKNNLQVIASLLNLQADRARDEAARRVLAESQSRVRAMALIHQLLYERKDYSVVDLGEYLTRLANLLVSTHRAQAERVTLEIDVEPVPVDLQQAVPCGLVVNELLTNCFKHAFPEGRSGTVGVTLKHGEGGVVRLAVSDDGVGLPETAELGSSASLGLQLVPLLAEQAGAELAVVRAPGTTFSLTFPSTPQERS
jgi:PAS domain S-box-containing protein